MPYEARGYLTLPISLHKMQADGGSAAAAVHPHLRLSPAKTAASGPGSACLGGMGNRPPAIRALIICMKVDWGEG
jgi:hypothetical protein